MLNVKDTDEVKAFLELARDRFEFGRKADQEDREIAEDDNRFAYADDKNLDQWDPAAKRARKKQKQLILQWNRIPTYVQQVANDGRQNKPSIKIAAEDGATKETAEYFQARIRHIEYESNADTAKDMARDQQVTTGRGFLRVSTEWIPGTQRQRIKIGRIENQFSVIWDPAAVEYDRSDADWLFLISHISKDQHIRKYGEKSVVSQMDFAHVDNELSNWVGVGKNGEMIQIAEYWVKEYEDRIVPASDGQPERKEKVAKICQYVINGAEILSDTEWLGSTIPIPPQWGKEAVDGNGKKRTFSLIRNAKEPQRFLNLTVSNLGMQMGQQAKTPWLVPQDGIAANHEQDWANIHVTPLGYAVYQRYDENGRELPAPMRNNWEPPIQALVETINLSIDAIRASMGIFDPADTDSRQEHSGIAIQRREKQSNISNYHFPDNEARTNKYLGEILVELIKKLDPPGSRNAIRTEDGKTHVVPIGEAHEDWKTGQMVTHDLLSGQYGVSVSTGPSYDSARAEKEDRDIQLVTAQPEMMYAIGGSMLRADDSAGSDERADAWEQYVSIKLPGMKFGKDKQQQLPQEVQAQMQQMDQQLKTTQAFAQNLHEQLERKQAELDNAVKLKLMDLQFQREKLAIDDQNKKLDIASKESIEQLQHDIAILMDERQKAHEIQQQQATQQHEADQADQSRQADAASQEQAQEHQTGLQDQAQAHAAEQSDADRQAAAEQAEGSEAAD